MQPVVKKLVDLIASNGWTERFTRAVDKAASYNIPSLHDIKTFDDYIAWIDGLLTWVPSENHAGKKIYNHICEFYFILDQPTVRELQNHIVPGAQMPPLTELSQWMVEYADAWGRFLDTTESITPESLESFARSPNFNLDEYMPPPSGYLTFNQLFARSVKPGMRPIAAIADPTVIVSAADSTFVGWWQINQNSRITVKGLHWSIAELLEGSPFKHRFEGGVFMHSFLNTTDYHRLHVPVPGKVVESRVIHGQVYLDVAAVPVTVGDNGTHELKAIRNFDAEDATGYQFAQARGLLVIDSPIGLVAVMPIGMAQVSSVVMTADVGKTLFKGQEFAYFQFGGSDHIVLFEAACNVALTAQPSVHYNQGQAIGHAYPA
ncbi:MAG TPA: phosphatidylserine decarboxylase [Rhizomicrobium sp.]|jgi:phosphatidylserine decarboxylase precursor|nr:phosphatidylserine decarboxylase [Rhizomicrobium sp.]